MNMSAMLNKIHDSFISFLKERCEDEDTLFQREGTVNYTSGDGYENSVISLSTPNTPNYDGRVTGKLMISPRDGSEPPVFETLYFVSSPDESEVFLILNQKIIVPVNEVWEEEVGKLVESLKKKNQSFQRVADEYKDIISDFEDKSE